MDNHLISLYLFYRSSMLRLFRIVSAVMLTLFVVLEVTQGIRPTIFMFLLNLQIMLEIFYRYRLCTLQGKQTLDATLSQDPHHVATLPAQAVLYGTGTALATLHRLLSYPQCQFFLERAGIVPSELPRTELGNAVLPQKALELAKVVGGKRLTTMDLLAAFLLLEEERSKLLFNKRLKVEDIHQILRWARMRYPNEEEVRSLKLRVKGGGIGETLVTGWTLETKKYTRNVTADLAVDDVSIAGREKEYQVLKDNLAKAENNNVVLIGETGVGKEQLVKRLVLDSYSGSIEERLKYKTVLELMVSSLLAGATAQGDLQARLQSIIEEVTHAGNVILYIPEFQNLIGAGSFALDLSGALVPYLKNGKLPIIASTTSGNYKVSLERNSLSELLSPVKIAEASEKQSELMVMEKTQELENKQKVIITYKALQEAVSLADRYSQNSLLPGSAITLLVDTIGSLSSQATTLYGKTNSYLLIEDLVTKKVEEKTKIALSEPTQPERDLLLHLEEVLHQKVIGQDEAITLISEAMRRIRTGMESLKRPVSFLFLGPTGVGKTETAKALSSVYFGSEQAMIRLDMSEYADEDGQKRLLGALPGEGNQRGELTEVVSDRPYALILLDEFEKAHSSILNLFLQIFEDGRLTDNRGQTVSFVNCIIIATSNAGSEFIHKAFEQQRVLDGKFHQELLSYLQSKNIFKPELLNRFDGVVTFRPLTMEEIKKITKLLLWDLDKTLLEKDITVSFTEEVIQKIVQESYNKEFGARPIRRYLQDNLEDLFSQKMLTGEIKRGDQLTITLGESNNFAILHD